jgi:surface protein
MFYGAEVFNIDISFWNTANVTNMQSMFLGAITFNQDIGNWDTSGVTNMDSMFWNTPSFNQDLTGWCVINFSSEPTNFAATPSALEEGNKPVWGCCWRICCLDSLLLQVFLLYILAQAQFCFSLILLCFLSD